MKRAWLVVLVLLISLCMVSATALAAVVVVDPPPDPPTEPAPAAPVVEPQRPVIISDQQMRAATGYVAPIESKVMPIVVEAPVVTAAPAEKSQRQQEPKSPATARDAFRGLEASSL